MLLLFFPPRFCVTCKHGERFAAVVAAVGSPQRVNAYSPCCTYDAKTTAACAPEAPQHTNGLLTRYVVGTQEREAAEHTINCGCSEEQYRTLPPITAHSPEGFPGDTILPGHTVRYW